MVQSRERAWSGVCNGRGGGRSGSAARPQG